MNKIKPGDWVAVQPTTEHMFCPSVKLPTDPRTLIRVYRAAMKWEKAHVDINADEESAAYDLWSACDKAKKAKRVK